MRARFAGARRDAGVVVPVTVFALVAGVLGWVQPAGAMDPVAPVGVRAASAPVRSVPVTPVKVKAAVRPVMPEFRARPVVWPVAGASVVDLPLDSSGERSPARVVVGGLPLTVTAQPLVGDQVDRQAVAEGVLAPGEPSRVRVETLDRGLAERAQVPVVARVSRADGVVGPGRVRVDLDYSGFRDAFGADWDSRLGLVVLPECVLVSPEEPLCQSRTPLRSSNDLGTGVVSAEMDLTAAGGDATVAGATESVVVALAVESSSDAGDFSKTKFSPSGSWQAGQSGGGFSWSYPLAVPPVPGGLVPQVSFGYSSAAVDGQTGGTNTQPGWIGEGWDFAPGFIERSYQACSEDTFGSPVHGANTNSLNDLCWRLPNARIMWNGRSTELIPVDASANPNTASPTTWKFADDDGTRVEWLHLTDGRSNSDNDNEYWRVTTKDGTQFNFGVNQLPGWSTGMAETQSVWTVPVRANHANEPCYNGSWTSSWCTQAYKWNLDYVVDRHGNSMTYFYTREQGYTGWRNNASAPQLYDHGGYLDRVEYGTRAGAEFSSGLAPARVVFTNGLRCFTTTCAVKDKANWPDTPWDLQCGSPPPVVAPSSCPGNVTPSFWTSRRLKSVQTQVLTGSDGGHTSVDQWDLRATFPAASTTSPVLWLDGITRTGQASTIAGVTGSNVVLPEVSFGGQAFRQRAIFQPGGGQADPFKYRVTSVNTETGGQVVVKYSDGRPDSRCQYGAVPPDPDYNRSRCFQQWFNGAWTWWHKYVVDQVTETDLVGGSPDVVHSYEYGPTTVTNGLTLGSGETAAAMWGYDTAGFGSQTGRTWSQWRGYPVVITKTGAAGAPVRSRAISLYFTGLKGDKTDAGDGTRTGTLKDSRGSTVQDYSWRAGNLHERIVYDGDSDRMLSKQIFDDTAVRTASRTLSTSWASAVPVEAWMLASDQERTWTWIAGTGSWRLGPDTTRTFDAVGEVIAVSAAGDPANTADDTCTDTTYNRGGTAVAANLMGLAKTVDVFASVCGGGGAVLRQSRIYYDQPGSGSPDLNAAPTMGDVTQISQVRDYTGSTANWFTASSITAYDSYGRATLVKDGLGRLTTSEFTETSGLTTSIKVTNAMQHSVSTVVNPARGLPWTVTDANGKTTTGEYDKLGRLLKVWKPGHAVGGTPDVAYTYTLQQNLPSWVRTGVLGPDGSVVESYEIVDGFLRARQSQSWVGSGVRLITDTVYDSQGLAVRTSMLPNTDAGPSPTLVTPVDDTKVEVQHRYTYDGVGRVLSDQLWSLGVEKSRVSSSYDGDRTILDQPTGGIDTTTDVDALGRTTLVGQHHGFAGYRDLAAADFTGDGKTDMVGVRVSDGRLVHWAGTGAGTFRFTGEIGSGWQGFRDLVAGDFNSDGKADLVAVHDSDGVLNFWPGTGSAYFGVIQSVGSGWSGFRDLVAADFNSDGDSDLMAVHNSDGILNFWPGTGSGGNFGAITTAGSQYNWHTRMMAADVTGDGKADLLGVRYDGMLQRWTGDGAVGFGAPTDTVAGFGNRVNLTAGDFTSDGKADVYGTDTGEVALQRWQSTGSTFTNSGDLPAVGGYPYDASSYTYDAAGQLKKVTDSAGIHWDYTYDLVGRKTVTVDPDAGTSRTVYDNAGQVASTTDGRGQVIANEYDALGRRTGSFSGSVVPGNQLTGFTYDTVAKGQPASSTQYAGGANGYAYTSRVTSYDDGYRPTGVETVIPSRLDGTAAENALAGTYASSTSYKTNGAPATTTLATRDGLAVGGLPTETLTYGYNWLGQAYSVINAGVQAYVNDTSYDYDGQMFQQILGNAGRQVRHTSGFENGTRRLAGTVTETQNPTTGVWSEQAGEDYAYDLAGNVKVIAGKTGGVRDQVECFSYDYLRRLTQAWTEASWSCATPQKTGVDPYRMNWTFDLTGNRTTQTTLNADGTEDAKSTYGYPAAGATQPHTLSTLTTTGAGAGISTYTYDTAGNTLTRPGSGLGTQTLQWDAEGHLAKITEAGADTTFVYDAGGNRLMRKDPGGWATLTLADGTELRANPSGAAVAGTRYYSGVAVRAVNVDAQGNPTVGDKLTWTITDHHGTGQLAIDAGTTASEPRRSLPYGGPRGAQASGFGTKGFVGGTSDPTGLTHLGAREYDPNTGRFISIDPLFVLGDPQSWNGYAYAGNSPATSSDPSGLYHVYGDFGGEVVDSGLTTVATGVHLTISKDKGGNLVVGGETIRGSSGLADPSEVVALVDNYCGSSDSPDCGMLRGRCDVGDMDCGTERAQAIAAVLYFATNATDAGAQCASCAALFFMLLGNIMNGAGSDLGPVGGGGPRKKTSRVKVNVGTDGSPLTNGLTSPSCNSFVPGTLVLMADGSQRPIENVEVGDEVVATDPVSGQTEDRRVTALIIGEGAKQLVEIAVDEDGAIGTDTGIVIATANHPFWVVDDGRWTDAGDLRRGDRVRTPTGALVEVVGTRRWTEFKRVHNLTIAGIHTYYVLAGSTPVLVHNSGCGVTSAIGGDSYLTKAAQQAGSNQRVQLELDSLQAQLAGGNMNPGIGTKSLAGTDVSYARGANGARLFFRNVDGGIQIVGKASKANEPGVINRLMQLYGQ